MLQKQRRRSRKTGTRSCSEQASHASLCHQLIQYYNGDKLILITNEEHYSDKLADVLVYSGVDDALEKLVTAYQNKWNKEHELEKREHE